VAISGFYILRPEVAASEAKNSKFAISSVRQLSLCEHYGMGSVAHQHIFVKVQDSNGEGINGVSVKVQEDELKKDKNFVEGVTIAKTETRQNLRSQIDPGHLAFAMFKGDYWVQLVDDGGEGISGIVGPLNSEADRNEYCGTEELKEVFGHYSYEVIFTQRQ